MREVRAEEKKSEEKTTARRDKAQIARCGRGTNPKKEQGYKSQKQQMGMKIKAKKSLSVQQHMVCSVQPHV